MNEVDPCLLLSLCVLYEIQNHIFQQTQHLDDLQETFYTLRRYKMKLNSSKFAFGVASVNFLGFMVSQKGIEANPDKIQTILNMQPPKNIKDSFFEVFWSVLDSFFEVYRAGTCT